MTKYEPFKLRPAGDWHSRPRQERLGHVMYIHLSDPATQAEILRVSAIEGKQGEVAKRIQSRKPVAKPNTPWKLRKEYR